ncbi:autophagy-related protein 2 [Monosporozyma servazzii]
MGFWLPQNLQKRLLLRVLQQISIFSNLDLSNLDISLGSNSKFSFNDIDLHVSELKVPYFDAKSGSLKQLDLLLNVSGGLDVDGKGIHFIIKIKPEELNEEDMIFSLTKSFQNLATSIIDFTDNARVVDVNVEPQTNSTNADIDQAIPGAFVESIPEQTPLDPQKLSKLQSMRNKVLNSILNKLTIILQDITIDIEDDNGRRQYEITLERISIRSREDNIRQISIQGLSINHFEEQLYQSNEDDEESILHDSKLSSTSMYMSALGSLKEIANNNTKKTKLFNLDFVQVRFQGLCSIENLNVNNITIDINNVDIVLSNIIKLNDKVLVYVVRSVKSLLKCDTKTFEDESEKTCKETATPNLSDPNENNLLSFFCIKTMCLQLTENNVIIFEQLYLNQADNGDSILNIDNVKSVGSDFQIKIGKKPILKGILKNDLTTLDLNSHLDIKVNKNSLLFIGNFYKGLNKFIDIIMPDENVSPRRPTKQEYSNTSPKPIPILITGKSISLNIEEGSHILSLVLDPFTFNKEQNLFSSSKLFLLLNDAGITQEIASINDISLKLHERKQKITTFNEKLEPVNSFTNFVVHIESILIYLSLDQTEILSNKFVPLFSVINQKEKREDYNRKMNSMRKSVRILTSSHLNKKESSIANQILFVKTIKFRMNNVLKETSLGLLKGKLLQNMVVFPCIGDEIIFTSESIALKRIADQSKHTENIISSILISKRNTLNLFIQYLSQNSGSKFKVLFNNIELRYKAKWLDILQELEGYTNSRSHDDDDLVGPSKKYIVDLSIIESALLLQPYRLNTCLLITFDYFNNNIESFDSLTVNSVLKNGSIFLTDKFKGIQKELLPKPKDISHFYTSNGFSLIGKIKNIRAQTNNKSNRVNMKFNIDQISLMLCADSFNSFIQTGIDLKYPQTFPDEKKYKNHLQHTINVMENIDVNFCNKDIGETDSINGTDLNSKKLNIVESFIDKESLNQEFVSTSYSNDSTLENGNDTCNSIPEIKINQNYLDKQKVYEGINNCNRAEETCDSKASILIDILINKGVVKFFDGYDWIYSRKMINKEISRLDTKQKINKNKLKELEHETNLFNSIYLTANPDINIKEAITETIQNPIYDKSQQLNLHPSKIPKLLFNFEKLLININHFNIGRTAEEESDKSSSTLNNVEVSVDTFDIVDNLITSTWNKFASLLRNEHWSVSDPMFHLHIDMLLPLDYLEAIEYITKIRIAPLRLHIDQDTLDFLIRFLGFKDIRFDLIDEYPDAFFFQKFEMDPLKVVIDYKPKKIDYIALKSGHINELMNFFTIDGSTITLKKAKLYGINGFDSLGTRLKEIWKPDIIKRQIVGILGGVAPLKTFVSMGSGVKTLVTVLMSQYKHEPLNYDNEKQNVKTDVFLRTSTGNFIKLSAKMITGTQNLLETAEEMLGGPGANARETLVEDNGGHLLPVNQLLMEDQLIGSQTHQIKGKDPAALIIDATNTDGGKVKPKIVSLYADQPLNIHQGLEEAYRSLEKHMQVVYETVWSEGEGEGNPSAAAVSVAKIAPIAIIRPLIGATEALSKALQGFGNQIDKDNIKEVDDKYKSLK